MLLVEQDILILPDHKSRYPVFSEVHVTQYWVFSVLFCPSLFAVLSFFFNNYIFCPFLNCRFCLSLWYLQTSLTFKLFSPIFVFCSIVLLKHAWTYLTICLLFDNCHFAKRGCVGLYKTREVSGACIVLGIFALLLLYNFSIELWNCSDIVLYIFFSFNQHAGHYDRCC